MTVPMICDTFPFVLTAEGLRKCTDCPELTQIHAALMSLSGEVQVHKYATPKTHLYYALEVRECDKCKRALGVYNEWLSR